MRKLLKISTLCALLASASAWAADDDLDELQSGLGRDWMLVKNDKRHNIRTYAKREDGKRYRSFKVDAVLDASLTDYTRMTLDFDGMKKWFFEVLDSKLLKKVSPTEYIVYLVHDAPPGLPDRDVILRVQYELQTPATPYLTVVMTALPTYLPPKPPLVRMQAENVSTRITPLPGNRIHLESEGFIDPGGGDPTWAVNFVQRAAPYNTLISMTRRLQNAEVLNDQSPLPFAISNVPH